MVSPESEEPQQAALLDSQPVVAFPGVAPVLAGTSSQSEEGVQQ